MNIDTTDIVVRLISRVGKEIFSAWLAHNESAAGKEIRFALMADSISSACLIAKNLSQNGITGDDLGFMAGVIQSTSCEVFEAATGKTLPTFQQILSDETLCGKFKDIFFSEVKRHGVVIIGDLTF